VSTMIEVDRVSKWFGELVAVSDVSFSVGPGVTALLGPNGAGKSTMLRMLCGLTPASQGTVRVLGRDPRHDRGLSRRIGLVPQQETLFESLSAYEFVHLAAVLTEVGQPDGATRAALDLVELDPDDSRAVGTFSKGMRQRVKVAQALVAHPEVVVLDEPLTGLDPRQRLHLITIFQRLGAEGRCVLVSSHVLDEVERFGSRVLVMAQGRLAAEGDYRAIRELMDDRPHRIRIRSSDPRALAAGLLGADGVVGVRLDGVDATVIDTLDAATLRRTVGVVAQQLGVRLHEVAPLDDDLESVFRYLVEGR
jgi:ABC-2 type transport system ATP-binding protein